MSFESPVQPVDARGRATTFAVLVGVLALAAVLVWQPWAGPSPADQPRPAAHRSVGASPTIFAAVPVLSAPPTASSLPIPNASRLPTPSASSTLYGAPPSADRFLPTWSVVGVRDLAGGGFSVAQSSVEPRATPRTGTLAIWTCDLGPQPDVGFFDASQLRLLGVVAPRSGRGSIQLTLIDGSVAGAFAVSVSYPKGTEDMAVGLYGVSTLTLWPRGAYRFYVVDDAGTGRYLYACLGG